MTAVNTRYVSWLLGLLIILLSASMLTAMGWSLYENFYETPILYEAAHEVHAFGLAMVCGLAVGIGLMWYGRKGDRYLGRREALLLVSSVWFVGAGIAALPFWFWAFKHPFLLGQDQAFRSFINCYFEAMSGLTTTGATVLGEIERLPKGLLLWRLFTHWIGGLGIVVIFVALLPSFAAGTKRLFSVESSGITNEGITPNIKDTARFLLYIYLGFTISQMVLLKVVDPDMTWFTAICHSFSTLGTGGFSTFNASAGAFTPGAQWVLILYMFLAGINFGLYTFAIRRNFGTIFRNSELQFYVLLILAATAVVFFSVWNSPYDVSTGEPAAYELGQRVRDSLFQVVSIQTSTGYVTANFEQWGLLPKAVLVFLMLVGGCGGSTAGGIKVIRILSLFKILGVELEKAFRPNVLRTVRIGNHILSEPQRLAVVTYVVGVLLLAGIGSCLLMITEPGISGPTALTASIATINNIGPGLEAVGAIENYGWFSDAGKLILCLLMAIGRLEVFAVMVIFLPGFWKHD